MIGNSNDETNFPHKSLLVDRQVAILCKVFVRYNSSTNVELPKKQIFKMTKSGGFLGRLFAINKNWFTIDEKCAHTIN